VAKTTTEAPPQPGAIAAEAGQQATNYSTTGDMIKARMPDLVKGAGLVGQGGNQLLTDQSDITTRGAEAAFQIRKATHQGKNQRGEVVKSLNPGFLSQFGNLATALSQPSIGEQLQQFMGAVASPDVMRSFTAGNLGIGSVYGNTPFNLLAPSRLIYPVYTVN
jgi:hypothetical protein